jgi:hypothetical protein
MGIAYNPSLVTDGLAYSLDFANTKNYAGSGSTTTDSARLAAGSLSNATYYSYDSGTKSMNFTRDAVSVAGSSHATTLSGTLAASTFLYTDFSVEVLARINDLAPGGYNANETESFLCGYRGYHAGFSYTSSSFRFGMWNGTSFGVLSTTAGTSSGNVIQGQWFHAVFTRSGTTNTIYINGVAVATNTSSTSGGNPGITNEYKIASGNTGTGPYAYYCKCNVALTRLYTKALSAVEVQQNFNSVRGRYGL